MNRPHSCNRRALAVEPLSAEAFAPYGDVIEAGGAARHHTINEGFAERFHDLAVLDLIGDGGRPIVSIFKALPRRLPMHLALLERHPLGSQAFVALAPQRFLVVVAEAAPQPALDRIRCFCAAPGQGVNYARGTWHHPLIALDTPCDFLVIDRGGMSDERNCDEYPLDAGSIWVDHSTG